MNDPSRFDLKEEPWVPVRTPGGTRASVGLTGLLIRAHEIADLEVPLPPAASGLWRVLYLLAARVTGLDAAADPAEFDARREELLAAGRFDPHRVEDYFGRYAGRFALFDTRRPWMQDPRLADECRATSGINRLVLGRPSGNNQVWFSHHHDGAPAPVPAAEAAWHLLAALCYGPSGRCTARTVGEVSEGNTAAGPLRGSLSCHPLGDDLFTSLLAGIPHTAGGPGAAPWEQPDLPDPLAAPKGPGGLGWLLAGRHQHAVLLTPDAAGEHAVDATLTWAWRERQPAATDPYLAYQRNRKGEVYPRAASATRPWWRDAPALLAGDGGEHGPVRPAVLACASRLPADACARLRLRVYGFDQDGQTRDRAFFTHVTPPGLHLGMLGEHDPAAAAALRAAWAAAEQGAGNLGYALACAWAQATTAGVKPDGRGRWAPPAEAAYWQRAEQVFRGLLAGPAPAGGDAAEAFTSLAEAVYDAAAQASPSARPRVAGALARNRRRCRPRAAAPAATDTESD